MVLSQTAEELLVQGVMAFPCAYFLPVHETHVITLMVVVMMMMMLLIMLMIDDFDADVSKVSG